MNIVTTYDPKPIATPFHDWSAIDQDTYDGAEECNCPIGRGTTEREAINDLVDQLLDQATGA